MQDYAKRLKIPLDGDSLTVFVTNSGFLLAVGYYRIVVGQRGPYVEFNGNFLCGIHVPVNEDWRVNSLTAFYVEYRTNNVDNVKVYYQKRLVSYADYKIGMYYVSAFDLKTKDGPIIEPLRKKK